MVIYLIRQERKSLYRYLIIGMLLMIITLGKSGTVSYAAKVKLSSKKLSLVQYDTHRLTLKNKPKGKITWTSSNKKVAKVSKKGLVSAVGAGKCKITATINKKTYKCTVKVAALKLSESELTLVRHRQKRITLNTENTKVTPTWTSSDPKVATVSSKGLITGLSKGSCEITAAYKKTRLSVVVNVVSLSAEQLWNMYPLEDSGESSQSKTKKVLLAGSSSLDYWDTAVKAFEPYETINTAIGGTTVEVWLNIYQRMICDYKPDVVIIYVGANDIANGGRITPQQNADNTIRLLKLIKSSLKKTPIYYVSIVPNWSRKNAWNDITESNALVKSYCDNAKYVNYIDIVQYFLTADGTPNRELFLDDQVHPNTKGYAIWKKRVANVVKKKLKSMK